MWFSQQGVRQPQLRDRDPDVPTAHAGIDARLGPRQRAIEHRNELPKLSRGLSLRKHSAGMEDDVSGSDCDRTTGRRRFGIRLTLMSRQFGATDIPLPFTSTLFWTSRSTSTPGRTPRLVWLTVGRSSGSFLITRN